VGGASDKRVPAGAMHADLAVVGMDSCFHFNFQTSIPDIRFYRS
jgi:hypothetical protein